MTCQDRIKAQQDRVKLLSGDERGHIVRQLKAKWDSVNEQYVPNPPRNMLTSALFDGI